jgi:hypothetical protein
MKDLRTFIENLVIQEAQYYAKSGLSPSNVKWTDPDDKRKEDTMDHIAKVANLYSDDDEKKKRDFSNLVKEPEEINYGFPRVDEE